MFVFVQKHRETGTIENLQKELVGEAERLDIKDKAVLVLCELLLGDNILQEVKTHRLLFLRVSYISQHFLIDQMTSNIAHLFYPYDVLSYN